jgi:shikimate kinase / 3-dehydroquinate synthase
MIAGVPLVPPIVLVGPPGAGKTTIAPTLAKALGMRAVDLDREVDADNLLRSDGVGALRVAEHLALREALGQGAVVVAAGGGIVDAPATRALLRRALVVHIDVTDEVCLSRLPARARVWLPAPGDPTRLDVFQQREQGRRHHRQKLARITVDGDKPTWSVVGTLVDAIRTQPVGGWWRRGRHDSLHGEFLQPAGFTVVDAAVHAAHPEVRADLVVDLDKHGGKSLQLVERIADAWLHQAHETARLVAIGGGTLLDVAGLTAALVHRGRPWVAVPTTLLAMVDASVGGKTAVDMQVHHDGTAGNVQAHKNQLGVIHAPEDVVVWPGFLSSISPSMRRHGQAEMIKHQLLGGPGIEDDPELHRDFKHSVVEVDMKEKHFRRALNLGHTVGHAIELACGMPHGDAVWWGLLAECAWASSQGCLQPNAVHDLWVASQTATLPPLPNLDAAAVLRAMALDKKGARVVRVHNHGCASVVDLNAADDDHRAALLAALRDPLAFLSATQ